MSRRVLWTPVILHPAAARKAAETWDVMTPDDARASEWWKHADAAGTPDELELLQQRC